MRRALVAANWKMNASVAAIGAFVRAWQQPSSDVDVVFCPPFGYVDRLVAAFPGGVQFGVQDVGAQADGAFTGEHSAEMAADLGAAYCIVGHSERRAMHGEDDAVVAGKFRATLRAGLTPVLCVGETLAERRAGDAKETVLRQLDAVLNDSGAAPFADAVVAYEPYGPSARARRRVQNKLPRCMAPSGNAWRRRMRKWPPRCASSMAAA